MWILGVIALPILAAIIYIACIDGSFRVRRSLDIETPIESAFDAVLDLTSWPQWSPWLLHEPEAEIIYSDDCRAEEGFYSWDGKAVGAGSITHVSIRRPVSIHQQLEFTRPYKSVNQVDWEFEKQGDHCVVSWEMSGAMPFLFRPMAKRMEPMIGRDFELGLALLAGYLQPGMPYPQLEFGGAEELEGFGYWAIPCHGKLRQLESSRRGSIETLRASEAAQMGFSLTLFHGFDPKVADYQAEIAIPVGDNPPPSNYQRRQFDGGQYFKLTLNGDLSFVPLAWHALASHCRMHKIKTEPGRPALEIYHQDPGSTTAGEPTVTTLYLPTRTK